MYVTVCTCRGWGDGILDCFIVAMDLLKAPEEEAHVGFRFKTDRVDYAVGLSRMKRRRFRIDLDPLRGSSSSLSHI